MAALLEERGELPRHVAIIMDGNGRWARRRFLPRAAGHRAGRHSVRAAVSVCHRLHIEALTLYTFSQENFRRPVSEVSALWSFLEEALLVERAELKETGVRLVVSGDVALLPERARSALEETIDDLRGGDGLVLNLALAYGGRQEIVHAAQVAARRVADGELAPEDITEETLRAGLYHPELPDPDVVIRTSGECRLSNFLIWQAAYAELLICDELWPDFRERQFLLALARYQQRERRFGGLPGHVT
ncbi:di-trans,poly-cis-decaprenylcistransferase [bacterium]|nr:di-trans,poly-cis-decaprenylcistransferase [bacterium]